MSRLKFTFDAPDWYFERLQVSRRQVEDLLAVRIYRVNFVTERVMNAHFIWDVAPFLWVEVKLFVKNLGISFPYNNKYCTDEVELIWPGISYRFAKELLEIAMTVQLQDHWSEYVRHSLKLKVQHLLVREPYLYLSIAR